MSEREVIVIERDCNAILIPSGDPMIIPEGTQVIITQALGGTYTVNMNGYLARIANEDADALGKEANTNLFAVKEVTGDGSVAEDDIWNSMRSCYDPEIPVNVVDLGLIYRCDIKPLEKGGASVAITMTLTAPGCGMGDVIAYDVKEKVMSVPNVMDADVRLTFDPPWDQSMVSEAGKSELGLL